MRKAKSVTSNVVPSDVVGALREMGVRLGRVDDISREASGWCPAHYERTGKEDSHPSWSVNIDSGLHNCFSCGFRGSFESLVSYVLRLDVTAAREWVVSQKDYVIRGWEEEDKRAVRGEALTEAELALFTTPPSSACVSRGISPSLAVRYGLLWDRDTGSWIIPIRDPFTNALWGWQTKNEREFKNVPRGVLKRDTLFGLSQVTGSTLVLVESPLDVARMATAGVGSGVSCFGSHVSEEQVRLLCNSADRVISALDNDEAGRSGNEDLRVALTGRVQFKVWDYRNTDAKDPGEQTNSEVLTSFWNAYTPWPTATPWPHHG